MKPGPRLLWWKGNFLSPVDLNLETKAGEVLAATLQPRGGRPADNGASNADTELKMERELAFGHIIRVIGLSLL